MHGLRIALPEAAVEIGADGLLVGCSADAHVTVDHAEVRHFVACEACMLQAKKIGWAKAGMTSHVL